MNRFFWGRTLLEVADVLYPSGTIKPEVYLRADITKGCRPRNVYLTHARCLAALGGWIAVRSRCRWGLSSTDEYRGLRPASKLVTTHTGRGFELVFKHRELDNGPEVYRACDSLHQTIIRLYRQAGIKQGSSHSGRRSLAAKKTWPQSATLRQFRSFSGMPISTTARCI